MYPFLRLGTTVAKAMNANRKTGNLEITDTGEVEYFSNPSDIDNFLEMNNGRIFTLFDLGRTDFAIRTGLAATLVKKRWGLVVAGSTIQYRKRVYAFQKFTIKTRVVGVDERWVYVEQSMWVKGKPTCSALLRTGITNIKTGKVIETSKVLQAMDQPDLQIPLSDWVQAWAEADKLRPWPPNR